MKPLKKIIYIEDNLDIIAIAKIAIEDIGGFQLECYQSGNEALQNAARFNPDLFIIDVMMPEMDGPNTLLAIRKIPDLEKIPIIFMTAKTQADEIKYYHELGAIGVITKPFDPIQLTEVIKNMWEKNHE